MAVVMMILALAAASALPLPSEPDPLDGCSRTKTARAQFSEKTEALRLKSSNDPLAEQTDVLHYRLDFEVDPADEYIDGSNTMTIRSLVDSVTAFRFWLHSAMSITAVEIDGNAAGWQRLDTEIIEVSLGRSFARGEDFELKVEYEGSPVTTWYRRSRSRGTPTRGGR
jgi:hypothetical protein